MTPQPMPVPTFTTSASCAEPATPISPSAITFTSLSTYTGHSYRPKALGIGWSCQPGMIGGGGGRPVEGSTGPGTPPPTAQTAAGGPPAPAGAARARRRPGLGERFLRQPVHLGEHGPGPLGDVDVVAGGGEDLRG